MKMIPPPFHHHLNTLRYIQPINVNNKINHIFACAHFLRLCDASVCLIKISYQMQK